MKRVAKHAALAVGIIAALAAVATAANLPAEKGMIDLQRPGGRDFVLDQAKLLSADDSAKIVKLCDKLLTEKATPIYVVTIDSMAKHGGDGMRIETFATLLFNQWEIGIAKINEQTWNTGILLLVSKDDRKARIELGAHWQRSNDGVAQKIMDEQIIPRFKQGDFSGGIVAGVESLDKLARGLELPKKQQPAWLWPVMIGGMALLAFTVVSLIRRGASGWAWLFWAGLFGIGGYLLYSMLNNSDGDGGFSGGGFGGGFSGGGGATGSW